MPQLPNTVRGFLSLRIMLLKKSIFFFLLLSVFSFHLEAQLDNTPFEKRVSLDTSATEKVSFNLRALGFNKNNEYYNDLGKHYNISWLD